MSKTPPNALYLHVLVLAWRGYLTLWVFCVCEEWSLLWSWSSDHDLKIELRGNPGMRGVVVLGALFGVTHVFKVVASTEGPCCGWHPASSPYINAPHVSGWNKMYRLFCFPWKLINLIKFAADVFCFAKHALHFLSTLPGLVSQQTEEIIRPNLNGVIVLYKVI